MAAEAELWDTYIAELAAREIQGRVLAVLREALSAAILGLGEDWDRQAAGSEIWDKVTEEAISSVMTASGEYGGFVRRWDSDAASAARYWARAGLEGSPLDDHPANYRDRHGTWHLAFATAFEGRTRFRGGRTRHG